MAVFVGALIAVAVYLLCVVRLGQSLADLKRRGRAQDAPAILFSVAAMPAIVWLVTGRYARLGDEAVTRWSSKARILLFALAPVYLLLFGNVILHVTSAPPPAAR